MPTAGPKQCFWCFDQPGEPYWQQPHFYQSSCWSFQDTIRRGLVYWNQDKKLCLRGSSEPIRFKSNEPRRLQVAGSLEIASLAIRRRPRSPHIADLGMAGSTFCARGRALVPRGDGCGRATWPCVTWPNVFNDSSAVLPFLSFCIHIYLLLELPLPHNWWPTQGSRCY